jgi:hypothetical protein
MPRLHIHHSQPEVLEEWEEIEETERQAIDQKHLHRPPKFRNKVREQRLDKRRKNHRTQAVMHLRTSL